MRQKRNLVRVATVGEVDETGEEVGDARKQGPFYTADGALQVQCRGPAHRSFARCDLQNQTSSKSPNLRVRRRYFLTGGSSPTTSQSAAVCTPEKEEDFRVSDRGSA